MRPEARAGGATQFLVASAAFIVVVAGMKAAAAIVVPFLLAIFITILCAPPVFWMQRHKVPDWASVLIMMLLVIGVGVALLALIGSSSDDFARALPGYQARLKTELVKFAAWLETVGVAAPRNLLIEHFNPAAAMNLAGNLLAGLSGVLTNAFLILLTVVFMLFEAAAFGDKIRRGSLSGESSIASLHAVVDSINRYISIKTTISFGTGLVIWGWLALLGVDFAMLWGLLAFLLNYVPNIGSIIAAVPAVLLAWLQLGTPHALGVAGGYMAVNIVAGNILEPRYMGRGLGLSTLVVFLSLVFWGWVLGTVGMLLSVPLTMALKIALEANESTRWLAVMLGPAHVAAPAPKAEAGA